MQVLDINFQGYYWLFYSENILENLKPLFPILLLMKPILQWQFFLILVEACITKDRLAVHVLYFSKL